MSLQAAAAAAAAAAAVRSPEWLGHVVICPAAQPHHNIFLLRLCTRAEAAAQCTLTQRPLLPTGEKGSPRTAETPCRMRCACGSFPVSPQQRQSKFRHGPLSHYQSHSDSCHISNESVHYLTHDS
eukprot:743168-Pelagomonas_calceolata.AAC.8